MKIVFNILMLSGLTLFCFQQTFACTCGAIPPPCVAYAESEAVFVGKVKEIKMTENHRLEEIEIEVIKNYKGATNKSLYTSVGSSSCDFESYKVGETFLLYGILGEKDKSWFDTSFCSRSIQYYKDLVDLQFLDSISSSEPFYLISGDIHKENEPIKGVKIEVTDDKKEVISGESDENGDFNIWVSKAGKYTVEVFPPPNTMFDFSLIDSRFMMENSNKIPKDYKFTRTNSFVRYEIEVKANECGWFSMPLQDYEEEVEDQ